MGTYLNPGKALYVETTNGQIFVDKSPMIRFLNTLVNTPQKYVSVSRPRRFGKTTAISMICAYYGKGADSRELFAKLKLTDDPEDALWGDKPWDCYLGKFDVVSLVMTKFIRPGVPIKESLAEIQNLIVHDIKEAYPQANVDGNNLLKTIDRVYNDYDNQLIIVIDEWDAIFRIINNDKEGQNEYLAFLKDLLKDNKKVALTYMTGILPIKKYGQHSALNMFDEYSMMHPLNLAPYTGFTANEVKELCDKFEMSYAEVSDWYDGYILNKPIPINKRKAYREGNYKDNHLSVYAPFSIVQAMRSGYIRNYWNKTETFEALAEFIRRDYDGLKSAVALLMDGAKLKIDTSTYQNDMTTFYGKDDILSLLVHLGYLGYDEETGEVFIPNKEILAEYKTSTKFPEWADTFRAFKTSQKLLEATWAEDTAKVADLLETAHDDAANQTYNDEAALSYAIQLAYYAAQKYYTKIVELDSGKGYADIVYLPSPKYPEKPVLLIEVKYAQNIEAAIAQIKNKNYPARLEHYRGNMLLVGIDYEKNLPAGKENYKRHTCRIERA